MIPRYVSISPVIGDATVDPGTSEIRVTFDRDMGKGASWTGGGPSFPKIDGDMDWIDARTCALPVKLEPGKMYSLGINSQSYRNFRSLDGIPAPITAVYFATSGGDIPANVFDPPTIVSLAPENGATVVSAATTILTVEFDRPMGAGFSFVAIDDNFPETDGVATWSEDNRVCTLKVGLKPNHTHQIGLNHENFVNFRSEANVPLVPVIWRFTTDGE